MTSYDIRIRDGDSIAAVTITDLVGEGAAERVVDELEDAFEGVER